MRVFEFREFKCFECGVTFSTKINLVDMTVTHTHEDDPNITCDNKGDSFEALIIVEHV